MQEVDWKPRGRDALQRECDMRADDAMNLCKEIDALNAEIARLRKALQDVCKHQQTVVRGDKYKFTGAWRIAHKALQTTGDSDAR